MRIPPGYRWLSLPVPATPWEQLQGRAARHRATLRWAVRYALQLGLDAPEAVWRYGTRAIGRRGRRWDRGLCRICRAQLSRKATGDTPPPQDPDPPGGTPAP